MARAAAKRNPRPKPAAKAQPQPPRSVRRAHRPVEETLFFNRLRRQTKWVFLLLALVFAGGFVFFGVGSGSTGIGDLFGNFKWFGGGSSGPSISRAQKAIAKNPKDAPAYKELAQAYEAKKQTDDAIGAWESYVKLRPKDTDALNALVVDYQTKENDAVTRLQTDSSTPQGPQLADGFFPTVSGPLGTSLPKDPLPGALQSSQQPSPAYQQDLADYNQALSNIENTYRRLNLADPTTPAYLIQYAQSAAQAGDTKTAIAQYKKFIKKFPDDTADVKFAQGELKRLQKQSSG